MKKILFLLVGVLSLELAASAQTKKSRLTFHPEKYEAKILTLKDKTVRVRAFETIVYVEKPVDTTYQVMNIYVPEAYFEGKSINGYTAENAPIFFPNQIGGYMPGKPATTEGQSMGLMPPQNGRPPQEGITQMPRPGGPMGGNGPRPNSVVEALVHGYVVASAGARGRTSPTGKAPAALVDLKAAIRYLKFNDKLMPGDARKIISNGTSAGGAMSTLLGATGNNSDYEPYLNALGAAPASDDILAVSAYCPITNLDHADMAYEWQFYGSNTYTARGPMGKPGQGSQTLTAEQITISKDLKEAFPSYINSLKLNDNKGNLLTLNTDGNGSLKELIKSYLIASAQKAMNSGTDLSGRTWLTITNDKVTDLDWDKYIAYLERQKTPPAFDALDLSTPEAQEFGTVAIDKLHFTPYGQARSTSSGSSLADKSIIKMMNPMDYIGAAKTKTAPHWRIRHGTKDKDGSLATPVLLATLLQNKGYAVNLELPWDRPHSGDYDLNDLFSWIDQVVKTASK